MAFAAAHAFFCALPVICLEKGILKIDANQTKVYLQIIISLASTAITCFRLAIYSAL